MRSRTSRPPARPRSPLARLSLLGAGAWGIAVGCTGDLTFERGRGAFCDGPSACATGLYCDLADQRCRQLKAASDPCSALQECATGFCVDGVCCDGPCNASCLSCSLAGSVGQCAVVPEGLDPHDDCPGTALCSDLGRCQGAPIWSRRFGGSGDEHARAVAAASDGSLVVVGSFRGSATFGDDEWESAGEGDVFLAALGPDGAPRWSRVFGSSGDDWPTDLVVADDGSIIVTGSFAGAMEILGTSLPAEDRDAFVLAFSPGGLGVAWSATLSGVGSQIIDDATWVGGDLLLAGSFEDEIRFPGGDTAPSAGGSDAFAARLAPPGSTVWHRELGDDAAQRGGAIAPTGRGEVVVAVDGRGTIDSGGDAITGSAEDDDLFLVRLGADDGEGGAVLLFGGQGDQRVRALRTASDDGLWLAGTFTREVTGPGGPNLVGEDNLDGFLTKLSATGAHVASLSLGGPFDDEPIGLAVDDEGNALVVGRFELDLRLGQDGEVDAAAALAAVGSADLFLLKVAADAQPLWSQPYGGPLADRAVAVTTSAEADVIAVGDFEAQLEFLAGDQLVATGGSDVFVAKFAR